jgi:hypothetical protein
MGGNHSSQGLEGAVAFRPLEEATIHRGLQRSVSNARCKQSSSRRRKGRPPGPPSVLQRSRLILPPVPLDHYPLPMPVNPAVRNPTSTRMRRTIPAARRPHVVAAFVTVIAIDPHIAPIRRIAADLDHRRRWANANRNLRKRSHRTQSDSEQNCQCNLLKHASNPPGV